MITRRGFLGRCRNALLAAACAPALRGLLPTEPEVVAEWDPWDDVEAIDVTKVRDAMDAIIAEFDAVVVEPWQRKIIVSRKLWGDLRRFMHEDAANNTFADRMTIRPSSMMPDNEALLMDDGYAGPQHRPAWDGATKRLRLPEGT